MMNPKVILVDENDREIGIENKLVVHQYGLLHRAFSIFIFREHEEQTELLLQQRHQDKYHSPNLWSNTCCSHPQPNEDIFTAAKKRLFEEMGFITQLFFAGSFTYKATFDNGLIEYELDHVLIGKYNNDSIQVNDKEVASYRWMRLSTLKDTLTKNPQQFTPWFIEALEIAISSGSKNYE